MLTRFLSPCGVGQVTDFMPVGMRGGGDDERHALMRQIHEGRGAMMLRIECSPRFDYARPLHTWP